ncbi:MAG: beta-ketoacyl synthase [Bacteroidota bacterium]|nr:beta-ketoacyl synthase [Bacteroidota bacterium]MDX5403872.1 beta-ketoacyl synthase [Bacteroidota bacterium]MDX5427510.1 beta-ketoacyl synthase [Bacteroidota bacterium]MDX5446964.1 beta-ketoacyl synthase [Bacteroidota bacterium]MDX5505439.1 beta-ketoacyl synthase [Bacteroidota bacterium]
MRPVAIHQIGIISPLGTDRAMSSRKVITPVPEFNLFEGFPVARIESDDWVKNVDPYKGFHRLDRSVQLAIYAAHQIKGGLLDIPTAVAIGSSRGATGKWEEAFDFFSEKETSRILDSPLTTAGNLASHVGHYLKGSTFLDLDQSITCASGLRAIVDACAWLETGFVEQAVAGGAEAPITAFTLSQMNALGLVPRVMDPFACRSLDPDLSRNTMVLGEGAVLLHLSQKLDLPADAYIVGVGFGSEPLSSATGLSPDGECLQRSMRMATSMAGWDRPDAIVAHAPGTVKGDRSEVEAIRKIWGEIPVTSTKFLSGHCFGASGPLGVWMGVEMMNQKRWVTPPWVSGSSPKTLDKILINAVGFGANAVSLAIANKPD